MKQKLKIIDHSNKTYISILLTALNFIIFVDRYSIISIAESSLKCPFRLKDEDIGSLTTFFFLPYMLVSPLIGYLGDTYSRKKIITFGTIIWVSSLWCGKFIKDPTEFDSCETVSLRWWALLTSRMTFGIGEACFICVSTAIIHDLHLTDSDRMYWLIIYSIGIPIGSGMGYILGAIFTSILGSWQAATVAITPVTILIIIVFQFLPDVPHGYSDYMNRYGDKNEGNGEAVYMLQQSRREKIKLKSEADHQLDSISEDDESVVSFLNPDIPILDSDIKSRISRLSKNVTFSATVVGATAVTFALGAGSQFLPIVFQRSQSMLDLEVQAKINDASLSQSSNDSFLETNSGLTCEDYICVLSKPNSVPQIFGGLAIISGLLGSYLGGTLTQLWKKKGNISSESDTAAITQLLAAFFMYLTLVLSSGETFSTYYLTCFLTLLCINCIWPVFNNIILSVVSPQDKCFAYAVQNFISHALGDVISPVIVGAISTNIGTHARNVGQLKKDHPWLAFLKIQQAMMLMPMILCFSSISFFIASKYFEKDLGIAQRSYKRNSLELEDQEAIVSRTNIREEFGKNVVVREESVGSLDINSVSVIQ